MLKLRARISEETRFRTPGLSRTIAISVWRRVSPPPGSARAGGTCAVWAGAAAEADAGAAAPAELMPGDAPGSALGEAPAPVPPGTLPFVLASEVTRRPRPTSR